MKHANAEMIKAVADNTELAIFCEVVDHGNEDGNYWAVSSLRDLVSCFNKFFVCLPQHKEACLHWLNGGEVQYLDKGSYVDMTSMSDLKSKVGKIWGSHCAWMDEDCEIRIKPKKEKRWIAYHNDGFVFSYVGDSESDITDRVQEHELSDYVASAWQYKEIEVEV